MTEKNPINRISIQELYDLIFIRKYLNFNNNNNNSKNNNNLISFESS